MKIRIRIDDVMTKSSAFDLEKSHRQINKIFRWCSQIPDKILFVPTILVTEIQAWPEVIDLVGRHIEAKTAYPELHGFQHIDYDKLSNQEVMDHLGKSMDWFKKTWNYTPKIWCTPWGASSERLRQLANNYSLFLESTGSTWNPGKGIKAFKDGSWILRSDIITIMDHWWERGLQLSRFIEIVKYGNFENAKINRPDLFN